MIKRIISGGQTGADQAGLSVAKRLGIPTGGFVPKGFLTEAGPRPDLAAEYGLEETATVAYPERTERTERTERKCAWQTARWSLATRGRPAPC